MARTKEIRQAANSRARRISVRAVRRDPLDVRRLGRAALQLAMEQAAAEAAAEQAETPANSGEGSADA